MPISRPSRAPTRLPARPGRPARATRRWRRSRPRSARKRSAARRPRSAATPGTPSSGVGAARDPILEHLRRAAGTRSALRALAIATSTLPICVPSRRWKSTRWPPSSTTAMHIVRPRPPSARCSAAATAAARGSEGQREAGRKRPWLVCVHAEPFRKSSPPGARTVAPMADGTVLVTGASGYVGRRLLPALLEQGVRARAGARPGSGLAAAGRRGDQGRRHRSLEPDRRRCVAHRSS